MHRQQHHVLTLAQPQQLHPQQRTALQIEAALRFFPRGSQHLRFALRRLEPRQLLVLQHGAERLVDHLVRHAVHARKARAQALVTRHDGGKRPLQRHHVELALQSHRARYRVGSAGQPHLLVHPDAFLRV